MTEPEYSAQYEAEAREAFRASGEWDWSSFYAGWKARDRVMVNAALEGFDRALAREDMGGKATLALKDAWERAHEIGNETAHIPAQRRPHSKLD